MRPLRHWTTLISWKKNRIFLGEGYGFTRWRRYLIIWRRFGNHCALYSVTANSFQNILFNFTCLNSSFVNMVGTYKYQSKILHLPVCTQHMACLLYGVPGVFPSEIWSPTRVSWTCVLFYVLVKHVVSNNISYLSTETSYLHTYNFLWNKYVTTVLSAVTWFVQKRDSL